MRRREFITLLSGAATARPLDALAQLAGKMWRIGYLAEAPRPTDDVFRQAMRELGYVEGRNLTIFYRWGESGKYGPLGACPFSPLNERKESAAVLYRKMIAHVPCSRFHKFQISGLLRTTRTRS